MSLTDLLAHRQAGARARPAPKAAGPTLVSPSAGGSGFGSGASDASNESWALPTASSDGSAGSGASSAAGGEEEAGAAEEEVRALAEQLKRAKRQVKAPRGVAG